MSLPSQGKYANSKGLFSRQQSSTYEENNRIEKTLLLVQSLGKSFANSKSYPIFKRTYSQLKREGVNSDCALLSSCDNVRLWHSPRRVQNTISPSTAAAAQV